MRGIFTGDREGKPNVGMWVYPAIMFAAPVICYFFFYLIVSINNVNSYWRPSDEAFVFSAIVGVMVCVFIVVRGCLTLPFIYLAKRIKEFFEDLFMGMPLKDAFSWYKQNVKSDGVGFWIIVIPMVLNVLYLIWTLHNYYLPVMGKPNLPPL